MIQNDTDDIYPYGIKKITKMLLVQISDIKTDIGIDTNIRWDYLLHLYKQKYNLLCRCASNMKFEIEKKDHAY